MNRVPSLTLALALLVVGGPLRAQGPSAPDSLSPRVFRPGVDSSSVLRSDTTHRPPRARKSPALAMLFSAVLPGAGQFYNRSYWKVPVVLGLGLYFASTWLDQNRRVQIYRKLYSDSLIANPRASAFYLKNREFYKEQRDTFAWYFIILYLVNVADAYVDASLYDFDVGPDLSLRVLPFAPGPAAPVPGMTFHLRF